MIVSHTALLGSSNLCNKSVGGFFSELGKREVKCQVIAREGNAND